MKKLTLSTLAFAFALTMNYAIAAPTNNTSSRSSIEKRTDERKAVKKEDLPAAVKTTLAGTDYTGWEIADAYWVKDTSEYYEINLKNADKTKTVKINKDGKKVE